MFKKYTLEGLAKIKTIRAFGCMMSIQKVILYSKSLVGDRLLSESSHLRPPLMCLKVKGCGMLRHDKKNG